MATEPQFVEIFTANDDQPEMARRLLEAAGDTPEVVATVFGGFRVPAEVAAAAGISASDPDAADAAAVEGIAPAEERDGEEQQAAAGELDGDGEVLRGEALDAALRDAGLSTDGKADEKRARLAEHRAGTAG